MTTYRCRTLVTMDGVPIDNGAVVVKGARFVQAGKAPEILRDHGGEVIDLGDVAMMPGLINAHCHLDYTGMAGEISPTPSFVDWLNLITTSKSGWIYSDFAHSWLEGAKMLLRTGVTTVGDIEMVPELLPEQVLKR